MKQLIYKRTLETPLVAKCPDGVRFCFARFSHTIFMNWDVLRSVFSVPQLLVLAVKTMTPSRIFFALMTEDAVVHYGWVSIGFCRYYDVAEGDSVIGPIWTVPSARGTGLATLALLQVMENMRSLGFSTFYIDTSEDNLSCIKAIKRGGFGEAWGEYQRSD